MNGCFVVGGASIHFGKHLDRDLASLAEEAADKAMADAGVEPSEIDAVFFANSMAGILTGQEAVRGQMSLPKLLGRPVFNVDNACASGTSAALLARTGLLAGIWQTVLVVGAEKMFHPDRAVTYRALAAAADVRKQARSSEGAGGSGGSVFMDAYAAKARRYMDASGATAEDLARVVVKNHANGAMNPNAQFQNELTVEEVLESGTVSAPLTRFMCSPISDGAAAVVLRSTPPAHGPVVELVGAEVTSGRPGEGGEEVRRTAQTLFANTGIDPSRVNVAEVHDAAANAELEYVEACGLCAPGQAPELLRAGEFDIVGSLVVNPSGGLLSRGHPVGATGVAQLWEVASQLRGTAGVRQVIGAEVGLVQNAGGEVGGAAAAASVQLLVRQS